MSVWGLFCTVFGFVLFLKTKEIVNFNGDFAQYYFSQHCACTVLAFPKNEHEEILWNTLWLLADLSAFIIYDHLPLAKFLFVCLSHFPHHHFESNKMDYQRSIVSLSPSQHTGARMCNSSLFSYFYFIFTKHNESNLVILLTFFLFKAVLLLFSNI